MKYSLRPCVLPPRAVFGLVILKPGLVSPRFELLDWTDLDASEACRRDLRSEPDRFIEVARFDDNKAADMLFRLGEWAVGGQHLA
jgi:hypothetical protein